MMANKEYIGRDNPYAPWSLAQIFSYDGEEIARFEYDTTVCNESVANLTTQLFFRLGVPEDAEQSEAGK